MIFISSRRHGLQMSASNNVTYIRIKQFSSKTRGKNRSTPSPHPGLYEASSSAIAPTINEQKRFHLLPFFLLLFFRFVFNARSLSLAHTRSHVAVLYTEHVISSRQYHHARVTQKVPNYPRERDVLHLGVYTVHVYTRTHDILMRVHQYIYIYMYKTVSMKKNTFYIHAYYTRACV